MVYQPLTITPVTLLLKPPRTCEWCAKVPQFQVSAFVNNPISQLHVCRMHSSPPSQQSTLPQSFVGYLPGEDTIVVSFRGSSDSQLPITITVLKPISHAIPQSTTGSWTLTLSRCRTRRTPAREPKFTRLLCRCFCITYIMLIRLIFQGFYEYVSWYTDH